MSRQMKKRLTTVNLNQVDLELGLDSGMMSVLLEYLMRQLLVICHPSARVSSLKARAMYILG